MVVFLNSWVSGIVVAVIVGSIIEMILPEGNNKKYVKIVIGVFIIFTIISPVVAKFSGNFNLKNLTNYNNYISSVPVSSINIISDSDIRNVYEKKVTEQIKETLENNGYIVEKINLDISTNTDNYAEIKKIILEIDKKNSYVENIKINISDNSDKKYELSSIEENNIKDLINSSFGIDKDKIFIN